MADNINIAKKLSELKIKPITDEVYFNHLKDLDLKGYDVKQFKYYKMYGDEITLYTEEYVATNSLKKLFDKQKNLKKILDPGLFGKVKMKVQSTLLRWGL